MTEKEAIADYNSCKNTDAIVAFGSASDYPAAWAARKYAPTAETKGKWCLAAAGVLVNIRDNQDIIQESLRKVGGVEYPERSWASSMYTSYFSWQLSLSGLLTYIDSLSGDLYIRPVLEF